MPADFTKDRDAAYRAAQAARDAAEQAMRDAADLPGMALGYLETARDCAFWAIGELEKLGAGKEPAEVV